MESAVDIESLAAWMTDQGLGSGPISNVTPLAGGTQNILLRLTRDGLMQVDWLLHDFFLEKHRNQRYA